MPLTRAAFSAFPDSQRCTGRWAPDGSDQHVNYCLRLYIATTNGDGSEQARHLALQFCENIRKPPVQNDKRDGKDARRLSSLRGSGIPTTRKLYAVRSTFVPPAVRDDRGWLIKRRWQQVSPDLLLHNALVEVALSAELIIY